MRSESYECIISRFPVVDNPYLDPKITLLSQLVTEIGGKPFSGISALNRVKKRVFHVHQVSPLLRRVQWDPIEGFYILFKVGGSSMEVSHRAFLIFLYLPRSIRRAKIEKSHLQSHFCISDCIFELLVGFSIRNDF